MSKKRIFVYGTLKNGERNHFLLAQAEFVSSAIITGYSLHDTMYGFPMVKDTGEEEDIVVGEIYLVDDMELFNIDLLEGYRPNSNSLYVRELCEQINAYVYVYHHDLPLSVHIENGIWTSRVHGANRANGCYDDQYILE